MNADPVSDRGAGIDDDVWKKVDLFAEAAVRADMIGALQNAARADNGIVADDTIRTDMRGGVYFCRRGDDRGAMDGLGKIGLWKKKPEYFCERHARIRHLDQHLVFGLKRRVHNNGRC